MGIDREWLYDALERVLWTAVQAVAATVIVLLAELDHALIPVLTAAFSAIKSAAAKRVGDPHSAATRKRKPTG